MPNLLTSKSTWLILPVALLLNLQLSDPLYLMGVDFVLFLQSFSSPGLDAFFIGITTLFDPALMILCVVSLLFLMRRGLNAYGMHAFLDLNFFLGTILKCFMAKPRPYWTHSQAMVIGFDCSKDYGSPSGHSQFVGLFVSSIMFELIKTQNQTRYVFLACFLLVTGPLSRLYLGLHSLDQVLFGLLTGITLGFLYSFGGLREQFKKLIVLQNTPQYRRILTLLITGCYLTAAVGYVYNDSLIELHSAEASVWMHNLNVKCNKSFDRAALNYMMLVMNCISISIMSGVILGIRRLLKQQEYLQFLAGQWKLEIDKMRAAWITILAYFSISIGLMAVGFMVGFIVPLLFAQGSATEWAQINLGGFLGGYTFSYWHYPLLRSLNLIKIVTPCESKQP